MAYALHVFRGPRNLERAALYIPANNVDPVWYSLKDMLVCQPMQCASRAPRVTPPTPVSKDAGLQFLTSELEMHSMHSRRAATHLRDNCIFHSVGVFAEEAHSRRVWHRRKGCVHEIAQATHVVGCRRFMLPMVFVSHPKLELVY